MENWITVISFTYPQEAYLAKAKLESEGIEVTIKDDLTAQVNNFYSNAIGGVKVQVKETDVEQAMQALLEAGYIKEETAPTPAFISEFDKKNIKIAAHRNANGGAALYYTYHHFNNGHHTPSYISFGIT